MSGQNSALSDQDITLPVHDTVLPVHDTALSDQDITLPVHDTPLFSKGSAFCNKVSIALSASFSSALITNACRNRKQSFHFRHLSQKLFRKVRLPFVQ